MVPLTGSTFVGLLMILATVPGIYMIWLFWDDRRNVAVLWYILAVVVVMISTLMAALMNLSSSETLSTSASMVYRTTTAFAALLWLYFTVEYTTGKTMSVWFGVPFAIVPTVVHIIHWVRPDAFYANLTVHAAGGVTWEPGPWGMVDIVFTMMLGFLIVGYLAMAYLTTSGVYRKQVSALLATVIVVTVGGALPLLQLVPPYINTWPLGALLGLAIIGYAFKRYRLFTASPVGKDTIFAELEDPAIVLNPDGAVIEMNPVARTVCGIDGGHVGLTPDEVFADLPSVRDFITESEARPIEDGGVTAGYGPEYTADSEPDAETGTVRVTVETQERFYEPSVTTIEYGRGLTGRVVVLRDITHSKHREQELNMLRQVFSRVFRHNVRNELTVLIGEIEVLRERVETARSRERLDEMRESSDRLLSHTEKARDIETVMTASRDISPQPVAELVSRALDGVESAFPDATIRTDVDDVQVAVLEGYDQAIENAVENALEHNPDPVTVDVTTVVEGDSVAILVEDDGEGIPLHEATALSADQETDLVHGSGVGLWLMKYYTERSNGRLELDTSDAGSTVTLSVPRVA